METHTIGIHCAYEDQSIDLQDQNIQHIVRRILCRILSKVWQLSDEVARQSLTDSLTPSENQLRNDVPSDLDAKNNNSCCLSKFSLSTQHLGNLPHEAKMENKFSIICVIEGTRHMPQQSDEWCMTETSEIAS